MCTTYSVVISLILLCRFITLFIIRLVPSLVKHASSMIMDIIKWENLTCLVIKDWSSTSLIYSPCFSHTPPTLPPLVNLDRIYWLCKWNISFKWKKKKKKPNICLHETSLNWKCWQLRDTKLIFFIISKHPASCCCTCINFLHIISHNTFIFKYTSSHVRNTIKYIKLERSKKSYLCKLLLLGFSLVMIISPLVVHRLQCDQQLSLRIVDD